jgi:hypothetical protein
MSKITVHAGDFYKVDGYYALGNISLRNKKHCIMGESISIKQIARVEIASEESVKSVGGALGWGTAGALALGPAGLLAGLILGGKNKTVTFVAQFKDGRKLMATTDPQTFTKLQAAAFENT